MQTMKAATEMTTRGDVIMGTRLGKRRRTHSTKDEDSEAANLGIGSQGSFDICRKCGRTHSSIWNLGTKNQWKHNLNLDPKLPVKRIAKKNLAGVIGYISACTKVTPEVLFTMEGILKETSQREKRKATSSVTILDDDEDMEETQVQNAKARSVKEGKKKATSSVHPFFKKGINDPSQPTIKSAMQTKKRINYVDLAITMWFYDVCIPMNACNTPYFQHMIDKITSIGYGYKAPNYHALRVNLLSDTKKYVSLLIDSCRSQWIESGCTIMSDGWRDIMQLHLINLLFYCPKGISFLKSIDASDIESNTLNLCNLFAKIVEMVGQKNVVRIVTDNAANYKLAGNMLCERHTPITWSPCATRCLNLVLKDVLELDIVKSLVTLAYRVTVFVYTINGP
ncbi:uncharacterized protein LOC111903806 [Lactuca sativa]|uniref:uncharacterized protein LOC111903806 n=1 Tax=Lactuca sativa TaxID=4236 RepID=UPI000CD8395B|nr:uncharacterized protein LOC111903806 [Lactuca sativa]